MLDTNSIIQSVQTAQELLSTLNSQRSQLSSALSPWLPAIAVGAAWLGRELNRLAAWSENAAGKIMMHGGIAKILWKLIWN
jgi:hypothetical protein